jgi:hypothetical protein
MGTSRAMLSSGLARGAAAGALGTVSMSIVMLAAQRLGLMGRQPPSRIAEAALESDDDDKHPDRTLVKALGVVSHFAFGAAAGAGYGAVAGRRAGPLSGVAYGLLIWAVSYAGWIPKIGIMPPPSKDRPSRPWAMILAHAVYGFNLGANTRAWNKPLGHAGP